jgi:hypothetical protein
MEQLEPYSPEEIHYEYNSDNQKIKEIHFDGLNQIKFKVRYSYIEQLLAKDSTFNENDLNISSNDYLYDGQKHLVQVKSFQKSIEIMRKEMKYLNDSIIEVKTVFFNDNNTISGERFSFFYY